MVGLGDLMVYEMTLMDASKNRATQNGWLMENPMNKWMIWGVPLFLETPNLFNFTKQEEASKYCQFMQLQPL